MKVFTRDYRIEHYDAPLFGEYFHGMKPCVLDIEATGLDPARCKVVLMGLLTETDDGLRVTQFLAENQYEENRVLEATLEFMKDEGIDYIITFNGLRYDAPFINTRLDKLGYVDRLKIYDFDLYRFLRKCSILPQQMDSLSQANVEKRFGIAKDRQDIISGRESVALYYQYALDGDSTIEKIILTHNREDVLQLYKLMKIAGNNDFSDILPEGGFHTAIAKYGFPVELGKLSARPVLNIAKSEIKICGDQIINPIAAAYFPDIDNPLTALFNATTSSFDIVLPIEVHKGSCYVDMNKLTDIKDEFTSDPDLVNDFLILNPRTINALSKSIVSQY